MLSIFKRVCQEPHFLKTQIEGKAASFLNMIFLHEHIFKLAEIFGKYFQNIGKATEESSFFATVEGC